ncbi:MAG: T9SS type A sorting domain-containing protein [Flavobacteriales bacterium]|nr:T9SS type A sorting domain-containing protein [Flavobacteriales bacterium]
MKRLMLVGSFALWGAGLNAQVSAVCQDITVYLDETGSATIAPEDLDGGSTGPIVTYTASQTTFDCGDIVNPPALIITAVYDGPLSGGTPKGVELYVREDIPDLSMFGLGSANNGGGTDGEEFTFPADAASAGTFIYVASESTQFTNWFGFAPDYTSGSMSINGDDAVELFMGGAVIDVFGDINVDGSGQPWEYMDGWAYRNDLTGPDGSDFTMANWTFSSPNALDGETSNATATTPIPIATFTPSTSGTGFILVQLNVTDGLGSNDSCVAMVTVLDTLPPVMACESPTIMLDATGMATITVDMLDAGTEDNCELDSVYMVPASITVDCSDLESMDIMIYAVDIHGNLDSCLNTVSFDASEVISAEVVSVTDVTCNGDMDGAIDVSSTGGSGVYTFDWDNDGTGDDDDVEDLSGLSGGTYELVVTDENGCMGSVSVDVEEPAELVLTITQSGADLTADATGTSYQWIDCSDDSPISGETNQTFTPTQNGDYACIITDGDCSDTTDCISVTDVGVEGNSIAPFVVYPNPAQDVLFVEFSGLEGEANLQLLDLKGNVLQTRTNLQAKETIGLTELAAGVYVLRLNTATGSTDQKVIVMDK